MARYKTYDYAQLLMIPVSLENQLVPGTLEYAIHHVIEERVDTSIFDEKYRNDDTGRTAYDPKVLLKIVLMARRTAYSRATADNPAENDEAVRSARTAAGKGRVVP